LAQNFTGSSGVTFTITTAGQLQITPTVLTGTGYTGTLKLTAKAFTQS